MADRPVSVRLGATVAPYIASMKAAKAATSDLYREIDKTNDRTAWLAQGVLALAPAFTTFGAGAVPVISGLATQMTVAIGAAGTMALAFTGIGDALGALNDYQLDPTVENLEQLNEAMGNIGPDGAEFVRFLDEVGPKFDELRMTAREGMFPGITEGVTEFMDLLPQLNDVVAEVSESIGQLASAAGTDLAGPEWEAFFDYLETDAKTVLLDMGETIGNFMNGLADMMVAFGPLTADFSDGFREMSESFADWAANLSESQGFQEFVDYVQQAAPKALDFLGSLVMALVELAEAAAPVGDVALPMLANLLDIIGALANSPIGPLAIGFAAFTSSIGRLSALADITGSGVLGKMTRGIRDNYSALRQATPTVSQFGTALYRAGQGAEYQSKQTKEAMAATKGLARSAVPLVGGIGLAAFAMSDLDDKMGLTNTASFTLMGALIGGGAGAVAGGLVGAFMDMRTAGDEASASQQRLLETMRSSSTGYEAFASSAGQAVAIAEGYIDNLGYLGQAWQGWDEILTGSASYTEVFDRGAEAAQRLASVKTILFDVGTQMEHYQDGAGGAYVATSDLADIAARAEPALAALGISIADLSVMDADERMVVADKIAAWIEASDTAAGRTRALAGAVTGLDDDLLSTADSASALATALEALLSPQLGLSEATDAWTVALRELNGDLAEHGRTLVGNSNAALANREAIRGRVTALMDVLRAEAESGASARRLAQVLGTQKEALVQAGIAAGLSGKELRKYLNQLGLTPDVVKTVIEAAGIEPTKKALRGLQRDLDKYGLTRATAVAALNDVASGRIKTVQGLIDKYGLTRKEATALLKDQASGRLDHILNLLAAIRDKTVTVTTVTRTVRTGDGNYFKEFSSGGYTGDIDPRRTAGVVHGGEVVIPEPLVRRDAPMLRSRYGHLPGMGELPGYADGGLVSDRSEAGFTSMADWPNLRTGRIEAELAGFGSTLSDINDLSRRELRERSGLLDEEIAQGRDRLSSLKDQQKALVDSVKSLYRDDLFGGGDPFADAPVSEDFRQAAAVLRSKNALTGDISEAEQTLRLLRELRRKGFEGPMFRELAASGDVAALEGFAELSRRELNQYERLYSQRQQVSAQVGQFAGADYGPAIREQAASNRELRQELRAVKQELQAMRKQDRTAPERTGKAVGSVINDTAAAAARRR